MDSDETMNGDTGGEENNGEDQKDVDVLSFFRLIQYDLFLIFSHALPPLKPEIQKWVVASAYEEGNAHYEQYKQHKGLYHILCGIEHEILIQFL